MLEYNTTVFFGLDLAAGQIHQSAGGDPVRSDRVAPGGEQRCQSVELRV